VPGLEASLQMMMGTTPLDSKPKPVQTQVIWELPPLPLSPIIRPLLREHPPPCPQALTLPQVPLPMTTMDMLMETITPAGPLPEMRVSDAIQPEDPLFVYPITEAHGKSTIKSLMRPQDIARRLLPCDLFLQLQEFCNKGCPAQCGPDWTPEVIKAATAAGPHISALIPENTQLIWEDIAYQVNAGFVRIISASELLRENQPRISKSPE
jgi:hypothetical protein